MGLNLLFTVLSVCLVACIPHGLHMGMTNIRNQNLTNWVKEIRGQNDSQNGLFWSVCVAVFPAGNAVGALLTNNKTGYHTVLFFSGLISLACQLILSLTMEARSVVLMILGRFFMGTSVGICAGAAPIYLSEISKESSRGRVVTWFQSSVTSSMFMIQIISFGWLYYGIEWRKGLLAVEIVPLLIGTFFMKFLPESPKFVAVVEKDERKAYVNLQWFRSKKDISVEFKEILHGRDSLELRREVTIRNLWKFSVLICLMVVISEQLCGISILIYFSTDIFRDVGFSHMRASYATLLMGFSMTFGVYTYQIFLECFGRRILYLISMGSLFFITILLTTALLITTKTEITQPNTMSYVAFGAAQFFALMYGAGVGPSRWLIIVEPFNFNARPLVASLVLFCSFTINSILVFAFSFSEKKSRYYMFIVFICFDLGFFIFGYFFLTGQSTVDDDSESSDDD